MLLSLLALFGKAGGPSTVAQELGVAVPALSGLRPQPAVAVLHEVGEYLAAVQATHCGPLRDLDH